MLNIVLACGSISVKEQRERESSDFRPHCIGSMALILIMYSRLSKIIEMKLQKKLIAHTWANGCRLYTLKVNSFFKVIDIILKWKLLIEYKKNVKIIQNLPHMITLNNNKSD